MSDKLIPSEVLVSKILVIRGHKVMLDRDLADLYGVDVRHLKRQVRRNVERFPDDFMFELTWEEREVLRCHFGTLERGEHAKYKPFAFTEHGILMLSSVLNSPRAIEVNIRIMRTFARLREMALGYKDLREKIEKMEAKYDGQFGLVFKTLKKMLEPSVSRPKKIGFLK
ncbi:MAG: ORF6N domain-containing protein [Endomicrobiia bacterium]|nr:ORF6N domain-containing protein [Endomicrobiia bacterium]